MTEEQFESLQKLIDRCVQHDYDALREALSLKKAYLRAKQHPDYIRKEIFRMTEELVAMNQQIPVLQSFAFDWNAPNFIWETTFIENLLPEVRKKYITFPYSDFDAVSILKIRWRMTNRYHIFRLSSNWLFTASIWNSCKMKNRSTYSHR